MSNYRIQGATGEWEVVIGLEVHAQVTSQSKLFSGAATAFGAEPNSQVSLVNDRKGLVRANGSVPVMMTRAGQQYAPFHKVRRAPAPGRQLGSWTK